MSVFYENVRNDRLNYLRKFFGKAPIRKLFLNELRNIKLMINNKKLQLYVYLQLKFISQITFTGIFFMRIIILRYLKWLPWKHVTWLTWLPWKHSFETKVIQAKVLLLKLFSVKIKFSY